MAFAPIAFVIPEYDRNLYKNWWLKAYEPGTTTPKAMATDQSGSSTASRYELNSEGFPVTAGSAFVVPHVDGDYDLWLFPTAAEADANDTTNALQFADNLGVESLVVKILNSSNLVITRPQPNGYTTDIFSDDSDPDAYESDYYDSNEINGSGAKWVKDGTTGTPGTLDIPSGHIYNANGTGYLYSYSESVIITQFGAVPSTAGNEIDVTQIVNGCSSFTPNLLIPDGIFMIDPAVSVIIRDGMTIRGLGQNLSGLLALNDVAGSVLKREFTPGVPNSRVQQCEFHDFSVFLNHLHQASEPANIQQGFNLRDVGRSTIKNCYSGNFRFGGAELIYPNAADKTQAMRGYPFVLGNRSASDIDYAGGEVNRILYCRSWWARKGITVDDEDLTGGVSASYQALIKGCDVQTVERGITQGSQFNVGCTFEDNLIQDVQQAAGSANTTFVYKLTGRDNIIKGGYVETPSANLTACVWLQTTAVNNQVLPFYHDVPDNKFLLDNTSVGSQNFVRQITESDTFLETIGGVNIDQTRTKAKVSFDNVGAIVDSMNVTSVTRNGVGDFTILVPTNIGITEETQAVVTILSNVSGNVTAHTVRTVTPSGSNMSFRIRTWNVNVGADEDFPKVWVSFKG